MARSALVQGSGGGRQCEMKTLSLSRDGTLMRFLHDVARRLSIVAMLAAVTVIDGIERAALAQSPAGQVADDAAFATAWPRRGGSRHPAGGKTSSTAEQRTTRGDQCAASGPGCRGTGRRRLAVAPAPPFQLNTREQELLDKILAQWEAKNTSTKTFKCKFERYEYDSMLKDKSEAKDNLRSRSTGEVKYKQPDHGMFHVVEATEFNANDNKYEKRTEGLEHWVCDGAAIYEFVPADKKLKVHPLPEEMRGEAIADGPIPFIFGAKADKMKQRYWLRDVTPKEEIGKRTWLEAFPKYQHDAGNFSSALLLLNDDFTIYGLQVTLPGGQQRTAFIFSNVVINDPLAIIKGDFAAPRTPLGWTKEVDPPPTDLEKPEPPRYRRNFPRRGPRRDRSTGAARKSSGAAPATPTKR